MSILRNDLQGKYCQIPNELITDQKLSNGAFRVLCLLFSKPDNWKVYNKAIMRELGIKKPHTMAEYWKECIESGWLSRELITDANEGTIGAYNYTINLVPIMGITAEDGHAYNGQLPKMGIHNNTNSLNNTKENKDATLLSQFVRDTNAGEVAKQLASWFILYRKEIKKPIKTISPLVNLIMVMRECLNAGYKIEEVQNLIKAKEWQSIKLEWVIKELGAVAKDEWTVS